MCCWSKRRPRFFRRLFKKSSASNGGRHEHVYVTYDQRGKTELSKKEVLDKYKLHIFVAFLFTLIVIFISVGWYFKDLFREQERSKQKIFIDPTTRVLTLADDRDKMQIFMGRDLPGWQLPLHCPPQPDGNPNSKSCEWKNNAIVHVHYFVLEDQSPEGASTGYNVHCYNVSWETLHPDIVPYDCFDVDSAVWYGPSNQSEDTLPIRGQFSYVPSPYHLDNGGIFSSVVDLYWLSSSGVGLLLNPEDPLTLQWNTTSPGRLCVISNYTGPLYTDTSTPPTMNYTICNGPDPVKTHLLMKGMLRGGSEGSLNPDLSMLGPPQWSVSGVARSSDYDQHDVLDLIMRLKMNGLNCSVLMLDGDWQRNHGDLTFDPDRFTNVTNMTDTITNTCSLGLQVSPYFDYRSLNNFHEGVSGDMFVKDAGGQAPGLTGWQSGPAVAMLDVSLDSARTWFTSMLTSILAESKAKGIRLSYGGAGWLPFKATFSQSGLSMFQLRRQMSHMVSSLSEMLVLEHTSGSQSLSGMVAVPTGLAVRGGRSCLANSIETAVTLGLLGYPYVLADGFSRPHRSRHQSSSSFPRSGTPQPSKDLFIRWMQMAAFFPALQFSIPPWIYDVTPEQSTTSQLAASLIKLHVEIMDEVLRNDKVIRELKEGLPLVRPVWWLDAGNATLHSLRISDQFLLGDQVLVAPVLCEGVTKRNIYVPSGVWKDKLKGAVVVGPKLLGAYPVAQHQVAYFLRMKTYDDHDNK